MPKKIRPIRVEGNIAYVPLTRGYEAMIDAADTHLVAGFNWFAIVKPRAIYAMRDSGSGERRCAIYLHRVIMGDHKGLEVDHIDCDPLNNRRDNLRSANSAQNKCNQRLRSDNASGFKGVSWNKQNRKWRAYIMIGGKQLHLGNHSTPDAAHAAYVNASTRLHGEFGRTT